MELVYEQKTMAISHDLFVTDYKYMEFLLELRQQ